VWTLLEGSDLAFQWFDDECLVHHALSNDTHRLAGWAAGLLAALVEMSPASRQALADRCGLDVDDVTAALDSLADLELVVRA